MTQSAKLTSVIVPKHTKIHGDLNANDTNRLTTVHDKQISCNDSTSVS